MNSVKKIISVFVLSLFLVTLSFPGSQAQEVKSEPEPAPDVIELVPKGGAAIKHGPGDDTEVYVPEDETNLTKEKVREMALEYAKESLYDVTYYEPTIQNLSKLYWALGMYDLGDVGALDYYLMINECQIYNDYYHDDFEWKKILNITKDYIGNNRKMFPRRFAFIKEINLGRYNFNTEAFYVVNNDLRKGTRRHEMRLSSTLDEICGFRGAIPGYPRNINLTLSRPFRLQYVPVSPDKAQDFIVRTRYSHREDVADNDQKANIANYERTAYVRIRVRVLKFLEFERSSLGHKVASVFAVLEGYDVFEDKEGERIIFTTGN